MSKTIKEMAWDQLIENLGAGNNIDGAYEKLVSAARNRKTPDDVNNSNLLILALAGSSKSRNNISVAIFNPLGRDSALDIINAIMNYPSNSDDLKQALHSTSISDIIETRRFGADLFLMPLENKYLAEIAIEEKSKPLSVRDYILSLYEDVSETAIEERSQRARAATDNIRRELQQEALIR